MSLELVDIRKTFTSRKRRQEVLRGVDLCVEDGEFVSLIGHSGCGKSTLLNIAGGLLRPDSGRVALGGVPVIGPGPDRAMVFQNYSLLPRLSMIDNVRVAVRAARPQRKGGRPAWPERRDRRDELAERYLTAVGLWEHRDKKPAQVSGGMQQRAAVARAFAVEPRVLLLDEPFAAVDALTRARLQAQLVELWQSGSETEIVVMVTHGIDEAILLSDRIVVLANPPHPSVVDVIPTELPRPRDRVSVIDDPHFRRVQERLMSLLLLETPEPVAV
ncbi:MAG: ABC transporter ATP-binding protein [Acidimicrobiia bacterium]